MLSTFLIFFAGVILFLSIFPTMSWEMLSVILDYRSSRNLQCMDFFLKSEKKKENLK